MPLEAAWQALRRHQLVRLSAAGWAQALAQVANDAADDAARDCLGHWAAHALPLVLARQEEDPAGPCDRLWLGLPTPLCWGRQRLRLQIARDQVLSFDELPTAADISPLLAPPLQASWRALCDGLAGLGLQPRVFGSHAWQHLTGLAYLRPSSDLDLLLPVDAALQADAAAAWLEAADFAGPRLDGELVFADGSAVAWREWLNWRARRCAQILVKRLDALALVDGAGWLDRATGGGQGGAAQIFAGQALARQRRCTP